MQTSILRLIKTSQEQQRMLSCLSWKVSKSLQEALHIQCIFSW